MKDQHLETEQLLLQETENVRHNLMKLHEEQIRSLKTEFNKLQRNHSDTVDILREENDAVREEIDRKNSIIEKLKADNYESDKLKRDYEARECSYKEQLQAANDEICRLKNENLSLMAYTKPNGKSTIQVSSCNDTKFNVQRTLYVKKAF